MVVFNFNQYLHRTAELGFIAHGERVGDCGYEEVTTRLEYIHRWTPKYKKWVLAKFYQLETHLKDHPCTVTMMTLTTYHGFNSWGAASETSTATIPEAFDELKMGWGRLRQHLRGFPHVWIMEPHKNGYPHIHVAILGHVTPARQDRIKKHWAKWGVGSYENGVQFSEKTGVESVKSIKNYLMKYMRKSFRDTDPWTTGETVFNALAWKNHWRLWGSTKDLTQIMKQKPVNTGVTYYATEMTQLNGDNYLIWMRPGERRPIGGEYGEEETSCEDTAL